MVVVGQNLVVLPLAELQIVLKAGNAFPQFVQAQPHLGRQFLPLLLVFQILPLVLQLFIRERQPLQLKGHRRLVLH